MPACKRSRRPNITNKAYSALDIVLHPCAYIPWIRGWENPSIDLMARAERCGWFMKRALCVHQQSFGSRGVQYEDCQMSVLPMAFWAFLCTVHELFSTLLVDLLHGHPHRRLALNSALPQDTIFHLLCLSSGIWGVVFYTCSCTPYRCVLSGVGVLIAIFSSVWWLDTSALVDDSFLEE